MSNNRKLKSRSQAKSRRAKSKTGDNALAPLRGGQGGYDVADGTGRSKAIGKKEATR